MITKSPARLAAASLASLLTLTACSSSDSPESSSSGSSEGSGATGPSTVEFDFVSPPSEGVSSIEFRVPEEVIDQEERYREDRYHDVITLTAIESDDPSMCAVEYQYIYSDGGLDRLLQDAEAWLDAPDLTVDRGMARALTDESIDSVELSDDYASAVLPINCSSSPSDDDNVAMVRFKRTMDSRFAYAEVSVMKSGDLFIHEFEIQSWQADSNGNWIRD
ncbi:hypothetical protein [Nocardiopsis prasina]|uniref:hypothetical protein n=1 Tax=Nocardiopsis prasina TaxID=2015 RepID=UPI00035EA704|nr:hypothetical protein [Nocardiopsis prasina]